MCFCQKGLSQNIFIMKFFGIGIRKKVVSPKKKLYTHRSKWNKIEKITYKNS